ncbi:4-alpha-glucanotransferase [Serratia proteamaculans]|nr:4-alpha-glucanotransferase [Serratia proteamaculans]
MDRKVIDQAAAQAGIAADYINAHGQQQAIAEDTKRRLLDAMGRGTTPQEVAVTPLPAVKVFYQGTPVALPLAGSGEYLWTLQREDGGQRT